MGIATDALAGNPTDLAEITVQIPLAITGKRTQPAMRTHPLHSLSLLAGGASSSPSRRVEYKASNAGTEIAVGGWWLGWGGEGGDADQDMWIT
jgi:hypothetical protein